MTDVQLRPRHWIVRVAAATAVVCVASTFAPPVDAHPGFPAAAGFNFQPNTAGGTGVVGSTPPYSAGSRPTVYMRVPFEQIDPFNGSDDTTVDVQAVVPAGWTNPTCGAVRTEINDPSTGSTNQPGTTVAGWSCTVASVGGRAVIHWSGPQVVAPATYLNSGQWFVFDVTVPSPSVQTTYNGAAGSGTEGFIVDQRYASGTTEHWIPNAAFPGNPPVGSTTTVASGLARTVAAPAVTTVVSDYDATELAAIDTTRAKIALSRADYQQASVGAVAFILGVAGIHNPTPVVPPTGSGGGSVATDWSPTDYPVLTSMATQFAVSPQYAQKVCSQIVAFLLSL